MLFNGSTSNVSCGNISVGASGTVNVWFKQDVATANKGLVGIGTNTWLYIGGSGANSMLGAYNGTIFSSGISLNGSTSWNFASFVWSGTTLTIYLNGGSAISSTISFTNSGNVVIGVYPSNVSGSYFNGRISNVQIYNRNLSAVEILQNYNATKTRYGL
jgi:hypothetical protein